MGENRRALRIQRMLERGIRLDGTRIGTMPQAERQAMAAPTGVPAAYLKPGTRFEGDGRLFETTGEYRPARKGEFIVGPLSYLMGAAVAQRDTEDSYAILREVA